MYEKLFSPMKLRGLELKNRVVLPGAETLLGRDPDRLAAYHAAIARGGCGLNIVECAAIHPTTHGETYAPLYKEEHVEALKKVCDAVHAEGGKIGVQIWHGGFVPMMFLPEGQDAWFPAVMQKEQVEEVIEAFGNAARLAVKAGFDCLELHGAHSYLIHEFLSGGLNMYFGEGGYNGEKEDRVKFMLEVIDAMRANMPEDMPLILRIDCTDDNTANGDHEETYAWYANKAVEHGVDAIDLSRGLSAGDELMYEVPGMDLPRGYNLEFIKYFKEHVNAPIIGGHRVLEAKMANEWLEKGYCDMVFVCRAQMVDHEWCNKSMNNQEATIRPCMGCMQGCYEGVANQLENINCVHNPMLCYEREKLEVTGSGKKCVVIGAGYSGIMAAQFMAEKGYDVSIYEKQATLGGYFKYAGMPKNKYEMTNSLLWDVGELHRLGVKVNVGCDFTPELIERVKPDVVIIATGAKAKIPEINGIENAVCFDQLLSGAVEAKGKIVMIGAEWYTGIDTALWLAQNGKDITCITSNSILNTGCMGRGVVTRPIIAESGIKGITQAKVDKIETGKVFYTVKGQEQTSIDADMIVYADGLEGIDCGKYKEICDKLGIVYKTVGFATGNGKDLLTDSRSVYDAIMSL